MGQREEMTLEQAMERAELERGIPQLERALTNPNLAASQRGSPINKMTLERIAQKRVRLAQLKKR
jgi:hypothetical protein